MSTNKRNKQTKHLILNSLIEFYFCFISVFKKSALTMTMRLLKDPATVSSRIFVGHLQTDDTTKTELEEYFGKYGTILGSAINRGFAFIQFDTEESAKTAIQKENGAMFKNRRIGKQIPLEKRTLTFVYPPTHISHQTKTKNVSRRETGKKGRESEKPKPAAKSTKATTKPATETAETTKAATESEPETAAEPGQPEPVQPKPAGQFSQPESEF